MPIRRFTVLYRPAGQPGSTPVGFTCSATGPDDARDQCAAAHPGCTIVLVR